MGAILVVYGTTTLEVIIMLGDLEHAFAWHVFSTQHILEKRNHVLWFLRTTERNHQYGVIGFY